MCHTCTVQGRRRRVARGLAVGGRVRVPVAPEHTTLHAHLVGELFQACRVDE